MSRGFVREGDQEEMPIIPPRTALPPNVPNYVTPVGLQLLNDELKQLEIEKSSISGKSDTEKRITSAIITAKMNQLIERINTARVIDPQEQPIDEVRFGAKVTFRNLNNGQIQTFQIVGVDEADVAKGKISFLAPIAVTLTGCKLQNEVDFNLGGEKRRLKIIKISYS
ncbi:MAG TPA: GreA/GreB family elongation factor [Flavobacteriaceae bacterium]|nr:GreA/GreB family elongation factor [Flavobacteriaceae bacterium]